MPKKDNSDKSQNKDNNDNVFREFIGSIKNFRKLSTDKHNPFESTKKTKQIKQPNKASDSTKDNIINNEQYPSSNSDNVIDSENLFQLSFHLWRPEVTAEEYLFTFQHGVQYRTIRKLRAGKIRVEATLDLHQMNKEQARDQLTSFILDSYNNEDRCICIIHGKGHRSSTTTPILKNLVNHWLQDIELVLGFCSCPTSMGGTGAVLVLLKRKID